ncbi:MAG: proprotein convertase P-domain-containing protein [bacterium]
MKKTTLLTFLFSICLFCAQAQISITSDPDPNADIPDAITSHTEPGILDNDIVIGNNTGDIITDVTVDVVITHSWVGDLILTLESPAGTTVQLMARPGTEPNDGPGFGCSEDNVDATFSDAGTDGPSEAACDVGVGVVGSFTPYEPLSAFDGETAGGTWTLTVEDYGAGDLGTLDSWTLNISGPTLGTGDNEIVDFKVFPNPAQNTLNVRAGNTIDAIQVYNLIGQEVLRDTPSTNERTLDISNLQTGAYFVKVTVDGIQETTRIIKQ